MGEGSWVHRYGFAAGAVACATTAVTLVAALTPVTPLILFAGAVAAAVLWGGLGPGTFALLLATAVSDFLFVEPRYELALGRDAGYLAAMYSPGLAAYVVVAVWRTLLSPVHPFGE